MKLNGEENKDTIREASNYVSTLLLLKRFKEAKSLFLKTLPAARRVLGDNDNLTLKMRWNYAKALYKADGATPDDLRGAVATLVDAGQIARRVLGGAHPLTKGIEGDMQNARAALARASLAK